MFYSENILNIEYDSFNQVLTVYFVSVGKQQYLDVPYQVYDSFLNAKSKGRYFNESVKDKFESKKIY